MVLWLIWFLQIIWSSGSGSSSDGAVVWRVSVPEQHQLCLSCGPGVPPEGNHSWTHGVQEVPPPHQDQDKDRDQDQDQDQDQWRFNIRPDGTLCILRLESSDSGDYYCNRRLRTDLQVLTGEVFSVQAGRTLLLPCTSSASKSRQRWSWKRPGSKRELVLTRSRDGTVVVEREDPRLGFEHDALRISPLQSWDSGEYQCNGERLATVSVQSEPKPTSCSPDHSGTSVTPSVRETETKEKRSENLLLTTVVVCLGLMVLMTTAVCVFLVSLKCRRKRRRRREAKVSAESTELQPRTTAHKPCERGETVCPTPQEEEEEEEIHYASLGRPTWKHRPIRTTGGSEEHRVIYSSICTKK